MSAQDDDGPRPVMASVPNLPLTPDQGVGLLARCSLPAVVIDERGQLVARNTLAQAVTPELALGDSLFEQMKAPGAFALLVVRARESDCGLSGVFVVGGRLLRTRVGRFGGDGSKTLVVLEEMPERRSASREIASGDEERGDEEISAEVRLARSLRQRDLMFRELQHRVKNNMQMLAGMLHALKCAARGEEAQHMLTEAVGRFSAVSSVQQLLYCEGEEGDVDMARLLAAIARGCSQASGQTDAITVDTASERLPAELAVPMALIVNELLTNALRHGCDSDGRVEVRLAFRREGEERVLTVEDKGPGIDPDSKAGTGLHMVRGLCRQIGGQLAIDANEGARVQCRFRPFSIASLEGVAA